MIVVGEIGYGIAVGWLSLRLRRWARDPRVEITLSLMTPYVAFWAPEHLGGSGVLATVAAGLFVSWNGPLLDSGGDAAARDLFLGFDCLLARRLCLFGDRPAGPNPARANGRVPAARLVLAVLLTTAVVIIARFLWVFPAVYLPRWLSPSLARRDPSPRWQSAFVLAFVGIRGVVSLAAALAIPLTTATGTPFPHRDLILSITFGVIIITLVGQGLLLPSVVRWLGLSNDTVDERQREHEAELAARAEALALAQRRLDQLAANGQIPPEVLATLRARHDYRVGRLPGNMADRLDAGFVAAELRMELITAEREFIYRLLQEGRITDEGRRRIERELDLEEASVACKREGGVELPL